MLEIDDAATADPRSDEVHEIGCVGRDAAAVPGFDEFGLNRFRE